MIFLQIYVAFVEWSCVDVCVDSWFAITDSNSIFCELIDFFLWPRISFLFGLAIVNQPTAYQMET